MRTQWINTPEMAVNVDQIVRITFAYLNPNSEAIVAFTLHLVDHYIVTLNLNDPGFDEVAEILADQGFVLTFKDGAA
jgi:hypothetical protein